jgi:abequosyltransferase
MTHKIPFLSICIPSYNRPTQLLKLLNSIDYPFCDEIEIIICEDKSPNREQIIKVVNDFKSTSKFECKLFLNEVNLGYDGNIKELIKKASGVYIMYMGDDDSFQEKSLLEYVNFLKHNLRLGYLLRRYTVIHSNGIKEDFKYFDTHRFFEPGLDAFNALFRKSVFISGFCFKREYIQSYFDTDQFNGTLLYQLFLCANLVLNYPSAYCDIPITIMDDNSRGIPEFGTSINESSKYTPGKISIQNSINFMKSFLVITKYIDTLYNLNVTNNFLKELSKYSYPVLSIQRDNGMRDFIRYSKLLKKEVNINNSIYYYVYFYALLLLGRKNCDFVIILLKKLIGRTPEL